MFDFVDKSRIACRSLLAITWMTVGVFFAANTWAAEPLVRFSNGEQITAQDFSVYLSRRIDLRTMARSHWGAEAALKEMALTRALALEGVRMGEARSSVHERFDDVFGLMMFKKLSASCELPTSAAAAKTYFEQHPDAFRVPASVRLSRVMLPAASKIDGEPAMAWLMINAEAIARGTISLSTVVARAEQVYKLEPQGDLGWVSLTADAAIMRALATAKKGELVGPLREGDFAYLFYIEARQDGRQLAWSEVETSAAARAQSHCKEQSSRQLTERLFKQYGVTFNQPAIRALFDVSSDKASPPTQGKLSTTAPK